MKGDIPSHGEKLKYKHFEFTVESVDRRRVKRIKITIDDN